MGFVGMITMFSFLILFLIALSCIVYHVKADVVITAAPGPLNVHKRVQREIEESVEMKHLQKMKNLHSDHRYNRGPKPRPGFLKTWISTVVPEETDEPNPKDLSTQLSMFYENEVDSGISDRMSSIKSNLEKKGRHLNGPKDMINLKTMAIQEWLTSYDNRTTRY